MSKLKIGETIQLGGKSGTIKFKSRTDFSGGETVIGVELNEWTANAGSGIIGGKKYFDTEEGKGFFIRNQSYA